MATTASGLTIPGSSPTTTAATPIQDHWNNLGKSLNGKVIVPVASVTARAALVSALTAEGYTISTSNPLYTHRADATVGSELEVTTNGTTWTAIITGGAVTAAGAASGPITGSFVTLATAPAVTGDGVKKFQITFAYQEAYSTVSGDTCRFQIRRPGADIVPYQDVVLSGAWANGRTMVVFDTPAAGVVTYVAAAYRNSGTGTITVNPSQIIVQQIA